MKISLTKWEARYLVGEIAVAYLCVPLEDRVNLRSLNRLSNGLILQLLPWMERSIHLADCCEDRQDFGETGLLDLDISLE